MVAGVPKQVVGLFTVTVGFGFTVTIAIVEVDDEQVPLVTTAWYQVVSVKGPVSRVVPLAPWIGRASCRERV